MKRTLTSIIAFILTLCMLAGCAPSSVKDTDAISTQPQQPSDSGAEPPTEPDPDSLRSGRLIYSENFDDIGALSDGELVSFLGWSADTEKGGAYSDPTASLSLREGADGKSLYIENNKEDASDSYYYILSPERFGFFSEESYTLQYDLKYTTASAADRYICILANYRGTYYDTFFLRNGGKGQHQVREFGVWRTYDVKDGTYCSHTDSRAISNILLGEKYSSSVQAFSDVDISIRYAVDRDSGYRAYIRVNTEGFPGSGVWTLVSESSPSSAAYRCYNSPDAGSALALKIGGKQNGTIDNILVWEGVADAPSTDTPLLDREDDGCFAHNSRAVSPECPLISVCTYCNEPDGSDTHSYTLSDSCGRYCSECGAYESLREGWLLDRVPSYEGGVLSSGLYMGGSGISDRTADISVSSRMMLVSETNAESFAAYLSTLDSCGFVRSMYREKDGGIFAEYERMGVLVYTYFTASSGVVRIIEDRASTSGCTEFGYTYEKKPGETTYLYQYGLPMNKNGVSTEASGENKVNNGMMYIVKCADNSLIVIDGGSYKQFDSAQMSGLMTFMRSVTGQKSGKIRISAWFITHMHVDHLAGFMLFLKKYSTNIDIERVMFNAPSAHTSDSALAAGRAMYLKCIGILSDLYDTSDISYLQLHTGQSFNIADVNIDVMYTHEDLVRAGSAESAVTDDFNNSSTVLKITFDGKSFLCTGDINIPAMNMLMQINSLTELKCDILQPAHHIFNRLSSLYHIVQAQAVLIPQSEAGCTYNSGRKATFTAATAYADKSLIFYAASGTARIEVKDGTIRGTLVEPVRGGAYTNWTW